MDQKKSREFIAFLSELMRKEENSWMFSELLSSLTKDGYIKNGVDDTLLLDIYEHCLEKNLRQQAENFYRDFPLVQIKDQLIIDFIAMENARRRNNFYQFALSIYQQFENINNYIFDTEIKDLWDENRTSIVSKVCLSDNKKKLYATKEAPFITEQEMLLRNSKDKEVRWFSNRKFFIVLYYFFYKRSLTDFNNVNSLNDFTWLFKELSDCRNKVHRGDGKENTDSQNETIAKVETNTAQYYFKFYYLLEQFVYGIQNNLKDKV
ncbi:hypothetical protein [Myroides odoratus]|uniref:Uncharacterized protein n=1 Tax=Myroides odoratus TaxID=256 RepID=A0A378RJN4_MYROD|nr:hypothetical protein [Myroides odoratus]QQU02184.1 hypothetical protein I6I89_09890 [Myroides odoratus]STZ26908.1 Uncharacterised protein [Myroides odoratus]